MSGFIDESTQKPEDDVVSKCFEYIGISIDPGDLRDLNALGSLGWHAVGIIPQGLYGGHVLLEREIENPQAIERTRRYYEQPEQALKRPVPPPVPPCFTGDKSEPHRS
jgi:hypothetical protein